MVLFVIISMSMFPFTMLAWDRSRGFVYAYYVLRTISYILSQGSISFVSVASAADVVEPGKRSFVSSWITDFHSVSYVLGNLLARFLPEKYIFDVVRSILPVMNLVELVEQKGRGMRGRCCSPA